MTSTTRTAEKVPSKASNRPLLLAGLLGMFTGIQAADPAIASTALLTSSRALHMSASTQALASSISR